MTNCKPNLASKKKKKSGTRQRLLTEAIQLFSKSGYDGVSVDEIVQAGNVNKRMVYHYFGSKKILYCEVLREVFGRLTDIELAAVNPDAPVEQSLETLVRAYFTFLLRNPEFVQLLLWENLTQGRQLMDAEDALSKTPVIEMLHLVLQKGIKEGRIRSCFDTKHLLLNLIGLCLIYFSNRYTLTQSVGLDMSSPHVLETGVRQIVRLIKFGILEFPIVESGSPRKRKAKAGPPCI